LVRWQLLSNLFQRQPQTLPHAVQAAHPADASQHLGGIQTLAVFAGDQARLDQRLQHGAKTEGAQIPRQQALAEVDQRGGMEDRKGVNP